MKCAARYLHEESFETTLVAIGLLVWALERSPSFDLEFDLEGMTQGQNKPDFWNQEAKLHP